MQSRIKAHFSHIFLPWVQIGSEQNRSNLPMGVAFNFNMMVYAYSLPSQMFCSCFWSLVCFLFLNLIRIFNRSWFRHGKLYTIMRSHISPSCAAEEASHKAAPQQGSNYGDQWCTDNVKPVQNLEPRASLFSTLFWQSPCSHLLEKKMQPQWLIRRLAFRWKGRESPTRWNANTFWLSWGKENRQQKSINNLSIAPIVP